MPQIFEFHFNPKNKENLIFDSFCFEPTNVYEKRLGSLYMVGLLKNALPQNNRFLNVLAEKIKEEYYKTISVSPEKSLRNSLKTANDYLEKIAKKGDVSWLGNLSFVAISLKNFEFNFTKFNNLKLVLIRNNEIIDIDQKVNFDEFEPYPLKIFGNIVSSKLAENDILLVLSEESYNCFLKENLLAEIAQNPIKNFKNALNAKKQELSKISGICLLIHLNKEQSLKERETVNEKKSLKIFSIKEIFTPFLAITKKVKLPKIGLPKNTVLVIALILFFFLGFYIFEKKEENKIKNYQIQIDQIQEKVNQADSYFDSAETNSQAKKKANILYVEIWKQISSLSKTSSRLDLEIKDQVLFLKKSVSEKLENLNKLNKISEPELVFEFKAREFIPRKIVFFNDELYLFTPFSGNIFKLNQERQGEIIETSQKISLAVPFSDSIMFFSKPNQITILKENKLSETINLEKPSTDFDFISFASFYSHLYFLDAGNNLILRYPFISEMNWKMPESWLAGEVKIAVNFKSMTIDGSMWLLTEKNSIQRYYSGRLQETIDLEIFPEPKNFSKIFTSLEHSYIYILEPIEKRIIILDKKGEIVKQFQSEKFDNLLDFSVSDNDKTIYLLNGMKLFKIEVI